MAEARRFNPQQFQEWRNSRLNQIFLRFLKDQQDSLGRLWAQGEQMSPVQQAKAQLLGELSTLEWADYAGFYEMPTEDAE